MKTSQLKFNDVMFINFVIFLAKSALKFSILQLKLQIFPGGDTPGPPLGRRNGACFEIGNLA